MSSLSRQCHCGAYWLLMGTLVACGGLRATFAAEKTTAQLREAILDGHARLEGAVQDGSGRLETYEQSSGPLQDLTAAQFEAQWKKPSANLAPLRRQSLFYRRGDKFRLDTAADPKLLPQPGAAGEIFVNTSPKSFIVYNSGSEQPLQIEFSGTPEASARFLNAEEAISPVEALTRVEASRVRSLLQHPGVKLTETSTPLVARAVRLEVVEDLAGGDVRFEAILDADHDYAVRLYEVRTRYEAIRTTKIAFTTLRRLPDGRILPESVTRIAEIQVPRYQSHLPPATAQQTRVTFSSLEPVPPETFTLAGIVPSEVLDNLERYTISYEPRHSRSDWSWLKTYIPVNESSGRGRNARTAWFVGLGALAVMLAILAVIRWRRWREQRAGLTS